LSQSQLAQLFVLWPMIFLAGDAAIFHEITCTLLQFHIINWSDTTGGAAHHHGCHHHLSSLLQQKEEWRLQILFWIFVCLSPIEIEVESKGNWKESQFIIYQDKDDYNA
jgi:hypothetical protein